MKEAGAVEGHAERGTSKGVIPDRRGAERRAADPARALSLCSAG
jgi:hypothetical protein